MRTLSPNLDIDPEARPSVSFRFWQVKTERTIEPFSDALSSVLHTVLPEHLFSKEREQLPPKLDEAYETIVEARVLTDGDKCLDNEAEWVITLCVRQLQLLLRAYQIATKLHVPILTKHRLQPIILMATRDAETGDWADRPSLYLTSLYTKESAAEPPLDALGMAKLEVSLDQLIQRNPVAIINERMVMARYALDKTGDYASAVLHAHITIEVLMDAVLTFMLFEEKEPVETGAAVFSERAQKKRVRTHYHGKVGGNWNPDTSKVLGQWTRILTPLRNKIVHAGYLPSYEEALKAIDVVPVVSDFVLDRIAMKRTIYPYTAMILLGKQGLEERKLWTKNIVAITETLDIPTWLEAYHAWWQQVQDLTNLPKDQAKKRQQI